MTERAAPTRVLVVLGATATGKTALAVRLAREYGGEIVSQDSRQVYRLMEIGTAKPTPEERAAVPHHGLDLVWPDGTWTLAEQRRLTLRAVAEITARGALPMLVGGTGQYLRAALEGWTVPEVPPDPELRERLGAEADAAGTPALHARLAEVDPAAAARIGPNDLRRIVRGLEVWERTGRPLSELRRAEPPRWDSLILGLGMERGALYERADARVDAMRARGLLGEVEGLLARGYGWELPAMRTIGYGEWRPLLEGTATRVECAERVRLDTHAFIRHQEIWFRRIAHVRWLDAASPRLEAEARGLVGGWFRDAP